MKIAYPIHILMALLLFGGALGATLAAGTLEVIQLQHRSADEVIPILKPFLDAQGVLSGTGSRLIVRTTPENLAQLHTLLKRVDTAPRRLIITVQQNADDSEVQTGDRHTRVISTGSRTAEADTQQIQVLEGHTALIQVGQSVPVLQSALATNGGVAVAQDQITYKDVLRGFSVLPRLNGDQVTLDISPYYDTPSQEQGDAIDVQRMHTTVSGRLGNWLEIGGSGQAADSQLGSRYTQSAHTGNRDQRRVLLKVEEVQE